MHLAPQQVRTFFITTVTFQRRRLFQSESLAKLLIDTIASNRSQGRFQVHEFVIMPDHLHLLLTPAYDISLEKAMQFIKGGFSFRVKRELQRRYEIWQPGFTEHRTCNEADFRQHAQYIQENPVRAKLLRPDIPFLFGSSGGLLKVDPIPPWLKPSVQITSCSPG